MASAYAHLICAAISSGCPSRLTLPVADRNVDPAHLDQAVPEDAGLLGLLAANGWHVDHGKWVCALHERKDCTCPPGSAPARTGGVCSGEDWCVHCA